MTHVLLYILIIYSHTKYFKSDTCYSYDITMSYININGILAFTSSANLPNCNYNSIIQNSNLTHREILEQIEEVDLVDLDVASALL